MTEVSRDQLEEAFEAELAEWKGKIPRDEVGRARFLAELADRLRLVDPARVDPPGLSFVPRFYDLRAEQDFAYPGGKKKARIRRGQPVRRDPKKVDGIVIHQTAVEFGVSAGQVRRSGGDRELALARRGLDVACHAIAFRSGIYVAGHDLEIHVNHGNALNATTLGLEIDGRYPGLEDDPDTVAREDISTTWGGKPTELVERTIATGRAALRYLVDEGRALGMPIRKIYAHRQSSLTRRSDPGQGIWREVVLDFGVPELGLTVYPSVIVRQGYKIPAIWDPDGVGDY